jgi:ATP-independent RNA helicase DbpA
MLQPERDKGMMKLRNGSATVLVTTDVAARTLDVDRRNRRDGCGSTALSMPSSTEARRHAPVPLSTTSLMTPNGRLKNWPAASAHRAVGRPAPSFPPMPAQSPR